MHLERPTYGCTVKLLTILFWSIFFILTDFILETELTLGYPHVHARKLFYFLQAGVRFLDLPGKIVPPVKLATKRMKGVF